ncbi:GDSL esterase/lipase At1g29670, partial [Linum grandiflorum]
LKKIVISISLPEIEKKKKTLSAIQGRPQEHQILQFQLQLSKAKLEAARALAPAANTPHRSPTTENTIMNYSDILLITTIQHYSIVVTILLAALVSASLTAASPQVPCLFIFGDSLNDAGNNNDLETKAKANYKPYGIDDTNGVTGRFTNGRTIVDFLAEELGFDHSIPPFTKAQDHEILQGVNYASGSAGILDHTGQHLGQNVPLSVQVRNHQSVFSRIANLKGNSNDSALEHLSTCVYYMQIGSNDYLNNYFQPDHYTTSKDFSVEEYPSYLITGYEKQVRILYEYGARKFAVAGIGKLGCIPYTMNLFGTNGAKCIDKVNAASQYFNKEAKRLVIKLNAEFKGDAKLIYINSYGMGDGDPTLLGFKNVVSGCCQSREDGQCVADQAPCENRAEYVFWDSFHPTEAANKATAARTYKSFTPSDCDPFDIHTLANFNVGSRIPGGILTRLTSIFLSRRNQND